MQDVPGTSSAYAERVTGGYYLDITPKRDQLARYGITVGDFQQVIASALGGATVTTAVEGLERYNVTVRYPRALRDDPQKIASEVFVPSAAGMIPIGQLASIELRNGPPGITTENALLATYVFVDIRDRDVGSCVRDAAWLGESHQPTGRAAEQPWREVPGLAKSCGRPGGTSLSHLSRRRRLGGCGGPLQERFAATCR